MSKPLNAIHDNGGMLMPERLYYQYCLTSGCMSWEGVVGEKQLEGYCKLMEEPNGTVY